MNASPAKVAPVDFEPGVCSVVSAEPALRAPARLRFGELVEWRSPRAELCLPRILHPVESGSPAAAVRRGCAITDRQPANCAAVAAPEIEILSDQLCRFDCPFAIY